MTYEDIKQMNNKELHANLREERKQLQKLQFNHAVSPIENPTKIKASKKVVARMLTEISARKKAENSK
ncbi:MAG: 50S ribosomal protein L29 [Bacteroidetes bacterium]|nr:50S ribosomal protein L29 [Bacteroidota bacterium]